MNHDTAEATVDRFLDELDHASMQWQVSLAAERDDWKCRRDKWRRPFRVPCEFWSYAGLDGALKHQGGHTRNISERGVGLLAAHPVVKGVPIEIRISVAKRPCIHLAGIVAFCRPTTGDMHEIGVSLIVQQGASVFHDDPMGAIASVAWIRDAVRGLPVRSRLDNRPSR